MRISYVIRSAFLAAPLLAFASLAYAADAAAEAMFTANNTWMLVATFLVFIMHLGFATLETGLTRAKNTVNILFKNTAIIAIGLLTYAICGFNLMYPGDFSIGAFFGFAGWGISNPDGAAGLIGYADGAYTYFTDFMFQAMFAATAATIVSGAVAERVKLSSFLIFSAVYVAFVYPVVGSWKWGGGWLDQMGFYDFAGSTLVHSVGGWAALVGVILLGPRAGKYFNGATRPIIIQPPSSHHHNMDHPLQISSSNRSPHPHSDTDTSNPSIATDWAASLSPSTAYKAPSPYPNTPFSS